MGIYHVEKKRKTSGWVEDGEFLDTEFTFLEARSEEEAIARANLTEEEREAEIARTFPLDHAYWEVKAMAEALTPEGTPKEYNAAYFLHGDRWAHAEMEVHSVERTLDRLRQAILRKDEHTTIQLMEQIRANMGDGMNWMATYGRYEKRDCFENQRHPGRVCENRALWRVINGYSTNLIFCSEHVHPYVKECGSQDIRIVPLDADFIEEVV